MKHIWAVGYGCYEDHGVYRYCSNQDEANELCAEKQADVGKDTNGGDTIQRVYVFEIIVDDDVVDPVYRGGPGRE